MRIYLKKEEFAKIENAFETLCEDITLDTPRRTIENSLHTCFPDHMFEINVIKIDSDYRMVPFFVMSVFPEKSTLDKIVENLFDNKSESALSAIWKGNKKWTIEIDSRFIVNPDFNNREKTAALLHEIGHIAMTDNIPNKIVTIMKYEISKASMEVKVLSRKKLFRPIFSLPILDICIGDNKSKSTSLNDEIKADKFVKRMGYSNDLYSAIKKIIKIKSSEKFYMMSDYDQGMMDVTNYMLRDIEELKRRNIELSKQNILDIRENSFSPYINDIIDGYLNIVYESKEDSNSLKYGRKTDILLESMNKDLESYYTEFFEIGKKKLKRLNPADLDYITLKMHDIQNQSDKMMLITYLYSKLDIVNYYLSILNDPIASSKYQVPHTKLELENMKIRLERYYDNIMNYKIPIKNRHLLIAWPDGYDG